MNSVLTRQTAADFLRHPLAALTDPRKRAALLAVEKFTDDFLQADGGFLGETMIFRQIDLERVFPHQDGGITSFNDDPGGQRVHHDAEAIRIWIATDGTGQDGVSADDAPAYGAKRRKEALRAAEVLGLPAPRFGGFVDRNLPADPNRLEAAIRAEMEEFRPDLILCPSPAELHADHRALARSLFGLVPSVGRYTPTRASDALLGLKTQHLLSPGVGAIILIAWAIVLAFIGIGLTAQRDIN